MGAVRKVKLDIAAALRRTILDDFEGFCLDQQVRCRKLAGMDYTLSRVMVESTGLNDDHDHEDHFSWKTQLQDCVIERRGLTTGNQLSQYSHPRAVQG